MLLPKRDPRPLFGIRVLELGRLVAAPFAAQLLADLGADVVKVEHPKGDDYRQYGPSFLPDQDGEPTRLSSGFISNNRNKRSIAVDFSTPAGAELVKKLADRADVFIENFKVGGLAKYGLDERTLRDRNGRLVYLSITGFGQTGPYAARPATDGAIQAMSGLQSLTGEIDGPPMRSGILLVDLMTGVYSALAIVAALRHRDNVGTGQNIDMALLDCAMASLATSIAEYRTSGSPPTRQGNAQLGSVPARSFACLDGEIQLQAAFNSHFVRLCECFGLPEVAVDPRFAGRRERACHETELNSILEPQFAMRTVRQVHELLVAADIICSPINSLPAALADPQVIARSLERDFEIPGISPISNIVNPIRFSDTPVTYDRPAPDIGEDTDEVISTWLGAMPDEISDLRQMGAIE